MKMRRIILIILFIASIVSGFSQVTIDQRVDTMQISIGEQTNLAPRLNVGRIYYSQNLSEASL